MSKIAVLQNRDDLHTQMTQFWNEREGKKWTDEDNAQWKEWKDTITDLDAYLEKANDIPEKLDTPLDSKPVERFFSGPAESTGPKRQSASDDDEWDNELIAAQQRLNFREWVEEGTVRGRFLQRYKVPGITRGLANDFGFRKGVIRLAERGDEVARAFLAAEEAAIPKEHKLSARAAAGQILGGEFGGTGGGGTTLPDEAMRNVIINMKRYNSIMEAGPTILTTETGNDVPIPTINDVNNKAVIVGEGQAAPRKAPDFGSVTLKAFRYSTLGIFLSLEFLQDTSIDVEGTLARIIGERVGRAQGEHYTIGTNSGEPQGIVPASTRMGSALASSTTAPTFAHIVRLMTGIDGAYQAGAGFMFNSHTLGSIMMITGINNQPIWFPSTAPGTPATLLGRPYYINDFMENFESGQRPMLYGNFSNYFVRNVAGLTIHRMNEKEIEEGMVGIVGFVRGDARLVEAGTSTIMHLEIG